MLGWESDLACSGGLIRDRGEGLEVRAWGTDITGVCVRIGGRVAPAVTGTEAAKGSMPDDVMEVGLVSNSPKISSKSS